VSGRSRALRAAVLLAAAAVGCRSAEPDPIVHYDRVNVFRASDLGESVSQVVPFLCCELGGRTVQVSERLPTGEVRVVLGTALFDGRALWLVHATLRFRETEQGVEVEVKPGVLLAGQYAYPPYVDTLEVEFGIVVLNRLDLASSGELVGAAVVEATSSGGESGGILELGFRVDLEAPGRSLATGDRCSPEKGCAGLVPGRHATPIRTTVSGEPLPGGAVEELAPEVVGPHPLPALEELPFETRAQLPPEPPF
jgi:hypothetical protein